MKPTCPKCRHPFPADQINVQADTAYCPSCTEVFVLSDVLLEEADLVNGDPLRPPRGVVFEEYADGWRLTLSTRSCVALFLVPFATVWSGASVGGIYGSQIKAGDFNLLMSLFGLPFLIGSFFLWGITIMAVCGKETLTRRGGELWTFVGAGPFGRTRKAEWSEVRGVKVERGEQMRSLRLMTAQGDLPFGRNVPAARFPYVLNLVRRLVTERR
jgi:hypothetical protein